MTSPDYQRMPVPELWPVSRGGKRRGIWVGLIMLVGYLPEAESQWLQCSQVEPRGSRGSSEWISMADMFVSIYFFWSYHSASRDVYDFETAGKNVQKVFDYAKEAGLWVVARPGPYCNVRSLPTMQCDLGLTMTRLRRMPAVSPFGALTAVTVKSERLTQLIPRRGSHGLRRWVKLLQITRSPREA